MHTKLAIIGAGPAGMAAAEAAAGLIDPEDILILERNDQAGKKLLLTGNGRCNITNTEPVDNFIARVPNGKFLYSAFHRYYSADTIALLDQLGIGILLEDERYYPASESAKQVRDRWVGHLQSRGVKFRYNFRVQSIKRSEDKWQINDTLTCDRLVLAGGGAAVPKTGSDGSLLRQVAKLGIPTVPFTAALCGIRLQGKRHLKLQGIRLSGVTATLRQGQIAIASEHGDVLFTHFGISGPAILDLSRFVPQKTDNTTLHVDLTAAWPDTPLACLQSAIADHPKRDFINAVKSLLPLNVGEFQARSVGINPHMAANQITAGKLEQFAAGVSDLRFHILGNLPLDQAILSAGGIVLDAVNPRTMAIKQFDGLYAAGEILNLAGPCGGYNLQIAMSTGHCAGLAAATSLSE